MHLTTPRFFRIILTVLAVIFMFFLSVSTGLVSALFPMAITIATPAYFAWESRLIDTAASLVLIGLLLMALARTGSSLRGDSPNDDLSVNSMAHLEVRHEANEESLRSDNTPDSNGSKVGIRKSFVPRRIFVASVLAGLVLVASLIDRAFTDPHPTDTLINNAIELSRSGQIVPAVESIMQVMPKKFTPSAFTLYYFASGWESEIGAWSTSEKLDVWLMRSSIVLDNPDALIVGLIQYDRIVEAPLPRSVDTQLLSSATSATWRETVEAAISWQGTGESSALVTNLERDYTEATATARAGFQEAIGLVRSYVKSYSKVG
jgi:hypothetical protein